MVEVVGLGDSTWPGEMARDLRGSHQKMLALVRREEGSRRRFVGNGEVRVLVLAACLFADAIHACLVVATLIVCAPHGDQIQVQDGS